MNRADWKAWRASRDPALMARLIANNQPLIQKFLWRFMQQAPSHPETLEKDLEQAARIGFMIACDRWKPKKGSFSTLAYYWIRHELQMVACGATPISYPRDIVFARCEQTDRFLAKHGRQPDSEEMQISRRERMHSRIADWTFIGSSTLDYGGRTDLNDADFMRPSRGGARQDIPDAEGELDERQRMAKLNEFMKRLGPEQRDALLRGDKKLLARAQRFFFGAR